MGNGLRPGCWQFPGNALVGLLGDAWDCRLPGCCCPGPACSTLATLPAGCSDMLSSRTRLTPALGLVPGLGWGLLAALAEPRSALRWLGELAGTEGCAAGRCCWAAAACAAAAALEAWAPAAADGAAAAGLGLLMAVLGTAWNRSAAVRAEPARVEAESPELVPSSVGCAPGPASAL